MFQYSVILSIVYTEFNVIVLQRRDIGWVKSILEDLAPTEIKV